MPYVAPSTVSTLQTYTSAAHNIIVNDVIDHESRINTVVNTQYPFRNVLVNGDMQIAQRGTSVASISSGSTYNTADRWRFDISSLGTWTHAVSADAPTGSGFRNSLRVTCSASAAAGTAGYAAIGQVLEGQTLQHIKKGTSSAQQLTLSFWAKSNKTGTYTCQLYDQNNTRSVSATYTISAADTWEQKTIVFPADTTGAFNNDNAASLITYFWIGAGTNYTSGSFNTTWAASVLANWISPSQVNLAGATNQYLAITGVQLEPGAVASPFEFVRYDDSLRRCQRYYQRMTSTAAYSPFGWGSSINTSTAYILIPLQTPMRIAPTGVETSTVANFQILWSGSAAPAAISFQASSPSIAWVSPTSAATFPGGNLAVVLRDNNSIGSYIGFTGAEL